MPTYEVTAPNGKKLSITGDHVPSESELNDIFAKFGVDTGASKQTGPTRTEQLERGATATLPVMGGVLGGIAGSSGLPVLGSVAGAGAGATLGEIARQRINQSLFGDQPSVGRQLAVGGSTAAGAGALAALPGVTAALNPSAIMADAERRSIPTVTGLTADAVRRGIRALLPTDAPILQRPFWQAAEGGSSSAYPSPEVANARMGTIGPTQPMPPSTVTVGANQPDVWDVALARARDTRLSDAARREAAAKLAEIVKANAARQAAATQAANPQLASKMPAVLLPSEAARQQQLMEIAKRYAQMRGMESAAYGKAPQ